MINLKIFSWNVNYVRGKMGEFKQFLTDAEIEILLIQERFLKPGDRLCGRGGGKAILVKKNIIHCHTALL